MDASQNPYQSPKSSVTDISHSEGEKLTFKQIWFSFEGRIPRKVFWLYSLLMIVPVAVIFGVAAAISPKLMVVVAIPTYIAIIWISFAIQIKRWHDRDKSGWWVLIGFVPVIGGLWALIENGFLRGSEGENRFGGDATGLY